MNILPLVLAAVLYHAEPTNGKVDFTIMKWSVIKEEGTFRDFRADIHLDQADPAKSRVEFEIEAKSIDTKNDNRDDTLRSEHFLHVAKHPKLTFRSTKVVPRDKTLADVTGRLTIRGVTRQVTVPVRLLGVSKRGRDEFAGFETTFKINRHDFGVTGGGWTAEFPGVLGDEVTIHILAGGVRR
jgi:polyisoprenoid-binding protein YceI